MKINQAFGPAAEHATLGENERANWLEKRIVTLEKWIKERSDLHDELAALVKKVKARVAKEG